MTDKMKLVRALVKPLVWVDLIGRMKCEAETLCGRYAIAQDGAWIALWRNGGRISGALVSAIAKFTGEQK